MERNTNWEGHNQGKGGEGREEEKKGKEKPLPEWDSTSDPTSPR